MEAILTLEQSIQILQEQSTREDANECNQVLLAMY